MGVVAVAIYERRAKGPVDEAAHQDRLLRRPSLSAEERAGDAADGVHPLLDVDGEREEIDPLPDRLVCGGGDQHFGAAKSGHYGPVGLEGQFAGGEGELFSTNRPGDRDL